MEKLPEILKQMESTERKVLIETYRALDEKSKMFTPYIYELVKILSDANVQPSIWSAAAKEIHRQLGNEWQYIAKVRREKLDGNAKNTLKIKLVAVLKDLKDKSLVQPVKNAFETVIFDKLYNDMMDILPNLVDIEKKIVLVLVPVLAWMEIMENVPFPSDIQVNTVWFNKWLCIFESGINNDDCDLKYATLVTMKNLISSLQCSLQEKGDDTKIDGFLSGIRDKIVDRKVFFCEDERVCIAGLELLTDIALTHKKNLKLKFQDEWKKCFSGALPKQLYVIADAKMKMGEAAEAVKNFFTIFHS